MKDVSVQINSVLDYCYDAPFHPAEIYPELAGLMKNVNPQNKVYGHFRQMLYKLGLDEKHYGTKYWNPFADFIKKGDKVVIKPNLVLHHNKGSEDICAVVTHASVIRPIIDYVLLALDGTGKIVVGDAPQANANFEQIIERNGLKKLIDYYKVHNIDISLIDFRKNWYPDDFGKGIREELAGDPEGYVKVNLGEDSLFAQGYTHAERIYGADYDRSFAVSKYKNGHEYLFSKSILDADVVIGVPKMKTHRKTGVTINAKNMVGANGDKNYLPHFRIGNPMEGGDEYPSNVDAYVKFRYKWHRLTSDYILIRNTKGSRRLMRAMNILIRVMDKFYCTISGKPAMYGNGDWHGNDTAWRMCMDLNKVLLYADTDGNIHEKPQRCYFSVVDGIIAGEADGPLEPTSRKLGYMACGLGSAFMVDYICIYQMGFDPAKLKVNARAIEDDKLLFVPLKLDVVCEQDGQKVCYKDVNLHFEPQKLWKGHIERT